MELLLLVAVGVPGAVGLAWWLGYVAGRRRGWKLGAGLSEAVRASVEDLGEPVAWTKQDGAVLEASECKT